MMSYFKSKSCTKFSRYLSKMSHKLKIAANSSSSGKSEKHQFQVHPKFTQVRIFFDFLYIIFSVFLSQNNELLFFQKIFVSPVRFLPPSLFDRKIREIRRPNRLPRLLSITLISNLLLTLSTSSVAPSVSLTRVKMTCHVDG